MKGFTVKAGRVGDGAKAPVGKCGLRWVGSLDDDLAADIVEYEPVDDIRLERREDHRHRTTHRTPDEARFFDAQCFEERADIAEIVRRRIAVRWSPLALAMTSQIERDHVMRGGQMRSDQIESVRMAIKSVQQDQVGSAGLRFRGQGSEA